MSTEIRITAKDLDPGIDPNKLAKAISQVLSSVGFNAKINMSIGSMPSGEISKSERQNRQSGYKMARGYDIGDMKE